jgi:hypothetical protein
MPASLALRDNEVVSELLSDLSLEEPTPERTPRTQRIEQAIVLMANSVWAVIGLILWIPQIGRVVVTSALRLIHAALTRQPIEGIRGPIRQVSRFYVDGFLSVATDGKGASFSARQWQIGRFVLEALWVALVWLAVLRLVRAQAFAAVWSRLAAAGGAVWERAAELVPWAIERAPETVRSFLDLGTGVRLTIAVLLLLALVGGFILGRRR